jgi:CHAT domain-containing protein
MSLGAGRTLVRVLDRLALDHERRPPGADRGDLLELARVTRREAELLNLPEFAGLAALREGQLLLAAGDARAAIAPLEEATRRLGGDLHARALALISDALIVLGEMRRALEICTEGIELIERDRDKTSAAYMQGAYLRGTIALYANGVRAAWELGDERALAWTERSKGRMLPELRLTATQREQLVALGERIERASGDAEAELRRRRRALFDRLLAAARGKRPEFDVGAVQAALAPGQRAVSYYWLDATRLLVAVVSADDVAMEVRRPDTDAIAALTRAVEEAEDARLKTTLPLLDRLLGRLDLLPDAIRGASRLLVSPHRRLHAVPFLALTLDGQWLVHSAAVATIPNLACLQFPAPRAAARRVIAVGINEYAGADSSLRRAEEAAADVAALYRLHGYEAEPLLGPEATAAALRQRLKTAPACLHLTLHGKNVDSDTPLESWLQLGGSRLDGLDLVDWSLAGTTVVLASCSSGQRALRGRGMAELPGDDVFGLQAALFCAGARQVLSAIWPVEFRVARAITHAFHRELIAGRPADVALQAAVTSHLNNGEVLSRRTTYWSPFTLSLRGGP